MKFALLVLIALWALASFACGGGGSNGTQQTSTASPASSLAGTSSPASSLGRTTSSGSGATSAANAGSLSGIFDTIFSSGLLNGSATASADNGDPALKNYLLTTDDLPAGFTSEGSFAEPV